MHAPKTIITTLIDLLDELSLSYEHQSKDDDIDKQYFIITHQESREKEWSAILQVHEQTQSLVLFGVSSAHIAIGKRYECLQTIEAINKTADFGNLGLDLDDGYLYSKITIDLQFAELTLAMLEHFLAKLQQSVELIWTIARNLHDDGKLTAYAQAWFASQSLKTEQHDHQIDNDNADKPTHAKRISSTIDQQILWQYGLIVDEEWQTLQPYGRLLDAVPISHYASILPHLARINMQLYSEYLSLDLQDGTIWLKSNIKIKASDLTFAMLSQYFAQMQEWIAQLGQLCDDVLQEPEPSLVLIDHLTDDELDQIDSSTNNYDDDIPVFFELTHTHQ